MSRKRSEAALNAYGERFVAGAVGRGVDRDARRAGVRAGARLLGLRLSQVARGRLRPARLPVDLAAGPLRPGAALRAVQRAADGLLPARLARPRGAAEGDRGASGGRERERGRVHGRAAARPASPLSASASATSRASPRRRRGRWWPSGERGGAYRDLADLASRSGMGRDGLERLAWAGACESLGVAAATAPRREELWRLGVARGGRRDARARPRPARAAARAARATGPAAARLLGADRRRLRVDRRHPRRASDRGHAPRARRRPGAQRRRWRCSRTAPRCGSPGLVVARQRPATAKGVVFMLLEDEAGVANVIVPPPVYERCRLAVRTASFALVGGRLERTRGRDQHRRRHRSSGSAVPGHATADGAPHRAARRSARPAATPAAERARAGGGRAPRAQLRQARMSDGLCKIPCRTYVLSEAVPSLPRVMTKNRTRTASPSGSSAPSIWRSTSPPWASTASSRRPPTGPVASGPVRGPDGRRSRRPVAGGARPELRRARRPAPPPARPLPLSPPRRGRSAPTSSRPAATARASVSRSRFSTVSLGRW